MVTAVSPAGRYDDSAGVCFEEAGNGFSDAQAWFAKQHRTLADRFHELTQRSEYFVAKTNGIIRNISDWVAGATDRRKRFAQGLQQAGLELQRLRQASQKGDWNRAYALLEKTGCQLDRVQDIWRDYVDTTSEGAQSVVRSLRVIRNTSAGFVGAGAAAVALGASTAMAGALATSSGVHAGFFSLSFDKKEYPQPPDVIALEVIDLDLEKGNQSSSSNSQDTSSVGDLPEEAPPAQTGSAYRRPKKSFQGMGTKRPPKMGAASEGKKESEEIRPTISLRMREEEVHPEEPIPLRKLYPSQADLQRIIELSPVFRQDRPRPVVQDPTGAYHRYADGGTLVRNPELGRHPVDNEVEVDDRITVDEYGNVFGVEEKTGRQGRTDFVGEVDIDLLARNAQSLSSLCDIYHDEMPRFFSTLNIFLDSSGSMGANFYVAPATTCAYQATLSALNNRAVVRVFNFSGMTHVTERTRDKQQIAKLIALYEGAGTFLPTAQLELLKEERARNDIIIISDGHIENYETALPYFWRLLRSNPRNRGYFVVVGKKQLGDDFRAKCIEEFKNVGFKVLFHG